MTWNPSAPDLILLNGNIRTLESQRPQAQASSTSSAGSERQSVSRGGRLSLSVKMMPLLTWQIKRQSASSLTGAWQFRG